MFLKLLNKEEQENFLELAYLIAQSGFDFEEPEEELLREFRYEMYLGENEYKIKGKKFEDIINVFEKSSSMLKISIFIELLALVLCDEEYDKKEQELIAKIKERFGITDEKYREILDWVIELQKTYKKGMKILEV